MQILEMDFSGSSDDEILSTIKESWETLKGWKRCQDGSFEMALSERGYYLACGEADKRGLDWRQLIKEAV